MQQLSAASKGQIEDKVSNIEKCVEELEGQNDNNDINESVAAR